MPPLLALIRNNRIVQLIPRPKPGEKWDGERLAFIGGRPDLKVGSVWPPSTVEQAILDGHLERAPTEKDPGALRVPVASAPKDGA
jgi:hypothetical protein